MKNAKTSIFIFVCQYQQTPNTYFSSISSSITLLWFPHKSLVSLQKHKQLFSFAAVPHSLYPVFANHLTVSWQTLVTSKQVRQVHAQPLREGLVLRFRNIFCSVTFVPHATSVRRHESVLSVVGNKISPPLNSFISSYFATIMNLAFT